MRTVAIAAIVLGAVTAVASAAPLRVQACDTNYWTVGCQYYNPAEGHTRTNTGSPATETVYSTFSPGTYIKAIATTSGGSWVGNELMGYGWTIIFYNTLSTYKFGCYNHNSFTVWVNCRAYD